MDETTMPALDWIHLPEGYDAQSLWACLHDGDVLSCNSDLANRSVRLVFDIRHLREKSDLRFAIECVRVTSVRATVSVRWPGECEVPAGVFGEQAGQLIAEYDEKGREQSLGWNEFESALATDPLSVMDAALAQRSDNATLKMGGFLDGEIFDDQYCTVVIRCAAVNASRSDGLPFSLQQLLALGNSYWETFASQRIG